MVCLDPETGERSPEPLKTLFALKGSNVSASMILEKLGSPLELLPAQSRGFLSAHESSNGCVPTVQSKL